MTISLRLLMSVNIALVAVVAAVICFSPLYMAGIRGVRSSLEDLRRAYVGRTQNQSRSFLAGPYNVLNSLRLEAARGLTTFNISKGPDNPKWYGWMFDLTTGYSDVMNVISIVVPLTLPLNFQQIDLLYCDTRLVGLTQTQIPAYAGALNQTSHDMYFSAYFPNGTVDYGRRTTSITVPMTESILEGYSAFGQMKNLPNTTVGWKPVRAGFDSPQLSVVALMRDPSGVLVAGVQMDLLGRNFHTFLASLGLRPRGRAVALDSTSGIVIGLSTAEPVVVLLAAYAIPLSPDWARMKLKTLYNLSDPLINQALDEVGRTAIVSEPAPFDRIVQTEFGRTYVDVLETTGPGLQLRTVLIMPELDFLEDVYKTQRQTIGGIAAAIVAMIVLAFVLGHVLTQPFLRLRDRMYLTASLQDDSAEDPPSLLTEVRGMQESYAMMRGELAKMKSYLPQSVLTKFEGGEESEVILEQTCEDEIDIEVLAPSERSLSAHSTHRREESGSGDPSMSDQRLSMTHRAGGSHRTLSGLGLALLNTACNLTHRRVSVACFNFRGFHSFCGSTTSSDIASTLARAVDVVSRHVTEQKGVVDWFQGDHLQASFNAVTGCAGHGKRAALVALAVVHEFARDTSALSATAGLSSGACFVGNIGSSLMKRFSIVGAAVPQAATLERLTRLFGATILCPNNMLQELALELLLRYVGLVPLPGTRGRPVLVAAVEGSKKLEGEEWMYQLKGGEDSDPFALQNRFYGAVRDGDVAVARETLAQLTTRGESTGTSLVDAQWLLTQLSSNPLDGSVSGRRAVSSNRQQYYDSCVASH